MADSHGRGVCGLFFLALVFVIVSTGELSLGQYRSEPEPSEQPGEIASVPDSGPTTEEWTPDGDSVGDGWAMPVEAGERRSAMFGIGLAEVILLGFAFLSFVSVSMVFCVLIGLLASKKGRSPVL